MHLNLNTEIFRLIKKQVLTHILSINLYVEGITSR